MTTHEDDSSGKSTFQKRLAEMDARAKQILADFMEQDPSTIDIADRLPYLPGMVLDALATMKDQLNDESRAAIDVWQEGKRQRYREMHEAFERSERAFRASLPPNGIHRTSSFRVSKSWRSYNSHRECHSRGCRRTVY